MTADFVRLETLLMEALKTVEQMKRERATPAVNVATAPVPVPGEIKQGDTVTIDVPQFQLTRRTDGKLELGLFIMLSNQTISRYPEVRYIADREKMWQMIEGVAGGHDMTQLPLVSACNWRAMYKYGKETGKGGRYKDLLSVGAA